MELIWEDVTAEQAAKDRQRWFQHMDQCIRGCRIG